MPDKDKYIYFGGLHKDIIISEESEMEMKEIEAREKEELEKQSLYYRQDYLRMKKSNSADFIYVYDSSRIAVTSAQNQWRRIRCKGKLPTNRVFHQSFYRGIIKLYERGVFLRNRRSRQTEEFV